ncbi:MAG: toxin TumE [Candidatus Latescibacterota bacterium]
MTPLEVYLGQVRAQVAALRTASVEYYHEQLLSATRASLRFRLRWRSGVLLEVREALALVAGTLTWVSYRYHFQDEALLLRYDDAPHRPELPTHPQHRHHNATALPGTRPTLEAFLREVCSLTDLR